MGRLKKKKTFLKKSRREGSEAEKRKTFYKLKKLDNKRPNKLTLLFRRLRHFELKRC